MTQLREENPDESFPPRETPPYDRDRFLPSGEPGAFGRPAKREHVRHMC